MAAAVVAGVMSLADALALLRDNDDPGYACTPPLCPAHRRAARRQRLLAGRGLRPDVDAAPTCPTRCSGSRSAPASPRTWTPISRHLRQPACPPAGDRRRAVAAGSHRRLGPRARHRPPPAARPTYPFAATRHYLDAPGADPTTERRH
ncbi:hypothetical protein NKG94_50195 [Micromonospora sp. M12]